MDENQLSVLEAKNKTTEPAAIGGIRHNTIINEKISKWLSTELAVQKFHWWNEI